MARTVRIKSHTSTPQRKENAMSLDIQLSISPHNLAPFRAAWEAACQDDAPLPVDTLDADLDRVPDDLRRYIAQAGEIAIMLANPHWHTDPATRRGLGGALRYYRKADDLIPDNEARFGLLDDAIVLQLALTEHRQEWQAWQEYRAFLRSHPELGEISREQWLRLRHDLHTRRSYVHAHYADAERPHRYCLLAPLPRLDMN